MSHRLPIFRARTAERRLALLPYWERAMPKNTSPQRIRIAFCRACRLRNSACCGHIFARRSSCLHATGGRQQPIGRLFHRARLCFGRRQRPRQQASRWHHRPGGRDRIRSLPWPGPLPERGHIFKRRRRPAHQRRQLRKAMEQSAACGGRFSAALMPSSSRPHRPRSPTGAARLKHAWRAGC